MLTGSEPAAEVGLTNVQAITSIATLGKKNTEY